MAGVLMLKHTVLCAALVSLAGSAAYAQSVISAHSGLIHYSEGTVFIGDKELDMKPSVFPEVKENEILRTEEGRVEMLLTPGVFLRLNENGSLKMVSNKLSDTQVEALSGTLMIECAELLKDNAITLIYKDRKIAIEKSGVFRLDASTGLLRVYSGEAIVQTADGNTTVKHGTEVTLSDTVFTASKFDTKAGDEFFRWAARRDSYIATANVSAAKSMLDSGVTMSSGQWAWSQMYNMFTYVPNRGIYNSFFGYGYYSPFMVSNYYYGGYGNGYGYGGGGGGGYAAGAGNAGARYDSTVGYNVGARAVGGSTYSNTVTAAPMNGASPAAATAPSRGDSGGASRGASSAGGRH
jgi:hypothetical protein